jgi:hypothetical protein
MKVYLVYDGDDVAQVFTVRSAAEAFADGAYIAEHEAYAGAPPTWTYWHRGAAVFPDGVVVDWCEPHQSQGETTIEPVDAHLNLGDDPWDGHTQGHCGEHISIFGTDREQVEGAYRAAIALALARQDGTCHSRHHDHGGDIDGAAVYSAGFSQARRRGETEVVTLACYPHFDHDWEHERPDLAMCRRCSAALLTAVVKAWVASDA